MSNPIRKISKYSEECTDELKKCSWPNRQKLIESTVVTTIASGLLALVVFGFDRIFQELIGKLA